MNIRPRPPICRGCGAIKQRVEPKDSPTFIDSGELWGWKCTRCEVNEASETGIKKDKAEGTKYPTYIVLILIPILVLILFSANWNSSKVNEITPEICIHNLEQKYKSQEEALWLNVHKILHDEETPIHSLILLYRDEGDTARKFAKDLMEALHTTQKIKDVLELETKNNVINYEHELVKYLEKIKKHKNLIVLKLQDLSFQLSRMFQVLCDESLSSYGPLYFISTLKDASNINSNSSKNANPVSRASQILRNHWSSLPEYELSPILSRIIRNAVEILPENMNS